MSSLLRKKSQLGFSYLELLVAMIVLMILASAVIPLARWDQKRRYEERLKVALMLMRSAIDEYKKYTDAGLILQEDVEQMGYPLTLEELVEGVEVGDPQSPDSTTVKFMYRIPENPFTGETEWALRSYQDDWDSDTWGGENIYDVYSTYEGKALDGSYYHEW
jgi:general secretion pathway protein G